MKRIIEISSNSYAHLFLHNLIVKRDELKIRYPISEIEYIIFDNVKTTISVQLLNELMDKNVGVIICNYYHLPAALLIPYHAYYSTKALQEQIKWNNKFKNIVWQNIIKSKIVNTRNMLISLGIISLDQIDKFTLYESETLEGDITNREGHAAKLNFKILFGNSFVRERNSDDLINSLLNYGYTILLSYVTRSLCAKGYDPRLSFFHKSYNNNFGLSCDIMEPFRCFIELEVYKYIHSNEIVQLNEFKEIVFDAFFKQYKVNGRFMTLDEYIENYINFLLKSDSKIKELKIEWELQ
ncbi:type II CRISPR-associated endonuclease Cas1 [Metamycoplasma equirhinis]|uniref:type II CRISPR-associated endonuclease Cas1 n=1 Tax=Metamycoplasma equirhinis TaxID=92402 RepID=UPI0035946623